MKRSIVRDLLILAGVFAVLWVGFSYLPWFHSSDKGSSIISMANEEKLGKFITDAIEKDPSVKLVHNPTLDSAMAIVKSRLVNGIGSTEYDYHIRVIESPTVNAFTIPGGNIYVYSGLIDFCETPEELAAVIGHEMGHAEKRHVVSRLVKELGVAILFSVIGGGDGAMISEIFRTSVSTVFDREQEKEADDYSFVLMEKSKLSPKSMASFMRRLREKYANVEKYTDNMEWMMTHPNTNSRIKASLEYKTAANFKEQPFSFDWQHVKDSLKTSRKNS
jgi:predicted Zn-dependent protease